jgi:non-heme chloroperoxidase
MPFISTKDNVGLFYRDWGAGEPVIFCAAWALSSVAWQYQMTAVLDSGRRALAYDRRGHGRSDDPGGGFDYDTLADDLAALIDRLDLHGVTLVAHSMASGEVIRYLTRHGHDRVDGLVLLAPTTPFPLKTADNPDGVDGALFAERRAQWRCDFAQWVLDNEGPYMGDGLPGCAVSSLLREQTKTDMLTTTLQAVIEFQRTGVETDFREELTRVAVPTLVIQGDCDASAPVPLTGSRTAALIRDCHLVVYDNAPHGLYLSHRDRLNRDLLAFIGGRESRQTVDAGHATAP